MGVYRHGENSRRAYLMLEDLHNAEEPNARVGDHRDYPSFSMTAGALIDRPLRKPSPSPPWHVY